jgi:hypothetical protein
VTGRLLRAGATLAFTIGSNEFEAGTAMVKDLRLGKQLAGEIQDREEWRKGQPAQQEVAMGALVPKLLELLGSQIDIG